MTGYNERRTFEKDCVLSMTSEALFEHILLDNIHYLRLLHVSGAAIEATLKHVEDEIVEKPIDGKSRVLVDFRLTGIPSIVDTFPHLLGFLARTPRRTSHNVRLAYVYPHTSQSQVLKMFLSVQRLIPRGLSVKFFAEGDYEQAVMWLRV